MYMHVCTSYMCMYGKYLAKLFTLFFSFLTLGISPHNSLLFSSTRVSFTLLLLALVFPWKSHALNAFARKPLCHSSRGRACWVYQVSIILLQVLEVCVIIWSIHWMDLCWSHSCWYRAPHILSIYGQPPFTRNEGVGMHNLLSFIVSLFLYLFPYFHVYSIYISNEDSWELSSD